MRVERRREREGVREREKERRKNGRECACERVWEGKSETERIKISQRLGNGHVGSRTFRTRRSDAFNYSRFEISIYRIFIKMLFFFFFKSTIFICCFVSLLPRWCYFSLPLSISLSLSPSRSLYLSLSLSLSFSFFCILSRETRVFSRQPPREKVERWYFWADTMANRSLPEFSTLRLRVRRKKKIAKKAQRRERVEIRASLHQSRDSIYVLYYIIYIYILYI